MDNTVRRWDARNGEATAKSMKHSDHVVDIAICTAGSLIVSSHRNSRIIRWKEETGEEIGDPIEAASLTRNLVISSNGASIACGSASDDFV